VLKIIRNPVYSILIIFLLFLISGVSASAPLAEFTADTQSGSAPLPVLFTDLSSNNPTGWTWFFGDETYAQPWAQVTAGAGWSTRGLASCVVTPDGTIVLIGGGWENSGIMNDVWMSKDYGATWSRMVEHAGWPARSHHTSLMMPDGSIVLMGGRESTGAFLNDVWRSTDNGATWTRMIEHTGWSPRFSLSSVALSDGSIIIMGGWDRSGVFLNDVWKSTDNGATWSRIVEHAGWSPRFVHSSVAMPDGSIVLMGGNDGYLKNDVWKSMDNGATWTLVNASAGWSPRYSSGSVVMPDGSIVLTGGYAFSFKNDIWRSTDSGATWTQITPAAGWSGRYGHNTIAMPDGSIVLMGGVISDKPLTYKNDVWRFIPAGSTEQNPVHTYAIPGSYGVALQAFNADGYTSKEKAAFVIVNSETAQNLSTAIVVTKTISPKILKQGTEARVSITVLNQGTTPVHDIEIVDSTQPEFPVVDGITQFTTQSIEPNGTRILSYSIHTIKPGSFRLNRTAVMYADQDGNYHMAYSNYEKVEVLPSLIPPTPQNGADALIRDLLTWINGLGNRNDQLKQVDPS
jgi:PKD repeat protein/photosystem II stability/assembly factor-like uncharacterized protein